MTITALLLPLLTSLTGSGLDSRTLRVDAVILQEEGREVAGVADHKTQHGIFTYWFATEDSQATFEADPERYGIQLGGACARMGPLSGVGTTDLFLVHDGYLYVFASEACQTGFLKAPDRLLEADDPVPEATFATIPKGRMLLQKAVAAHGGAEAIAAVERFHQTHERDVESGGRSYRVVDRLWVELPDRVRTETFWDEEGWGKVARGERAVFTGDEVREMVPSQRRALDKETGRDPLMVLCTRAFPGTLVTHVGAGEVDGQAIEKVAICRDGATNVLGIDPDSGRIVSLTYRGRGPTQAFGELEERFSDYRETGGVLVPWTRAAFHEGRPFEERSRTLTTLVVNGPAEPKRFELPAR